MEAMLILTFSPLCPRVELESLGLMICSRSLAHLEV